MKRILLGVIAALLLVTFAACGSSLQPETKETQTASEGQKESAENTDTAESENVPADAGTDEDASSGTASDETNSAGENMTSHSDVLVAYFSATGTTKGVAEKIAAITGGDLYEIVPAEPYSDADLDWNDRNSRSTKEQNDKNVRPEIGSADISLEGYTEGTHRVQVTATGFGDGVTTTVIPNEVQITLKKKTTRQRNSKYTAAAQRTDSSLKRTT